MQTLSEFKCIALRSSGHFQVFKGYVSLGLLYSGVDFKPNSLHGKRISIAVPNKCLYRSSNTNLANLNKWRCNHVQSGRMLIGPRPKSLLCHPEDTNKFCARSNVNSGNRRFEAPPEKSSGIAAYLVNSSPPALQPYMKLMRIDKPIGSWLLFWPCSWSIGMAAAPGFLPDPTMLLVFGLASFVMRGAACTINDLWDQEIDKKVTRTRERPLASGQISQSEALVFLLGLAGLGGVIILQCNLYTIFLSTGSGVIAACYPLFKRVTHWPQFVLGLALNWGALLGWAAVRGSCDWMVCLPLYAAGICWTIFYDTIYAHQDKADDLQIGIKSTAIRFGDNTKVWLSGFGSTMVAGLTMSGMQCGQTWPYYGAVGLVGAHLAYQLYKLDINNRSNCAQNFSANNHVGLILFLGVVAGTLLKVQEKKPASSSVIVEDVVT